MEKLIVDAEGRITIAPHIVGIDRRGASPHKRRRPKHHERNAIAASG